MLQITKLLYKAIRKRSNQNTEKSPGTEVLPFYCTGEMEMDHFGCLNSKLSLLYFCVVITLRKKIYGVHLLTPEPSPVTYTGCSTLLARPILAQSKCMYFIDELLHFWAVGWKLKGITKVSKLKGEYIRKLHWVIISNN